jgi:hypothetical protein
MKALYLSTASVVLAFGLSVSTQADDNGAGAASAADEQTSKSSDFTWVESATESSILTQAKAVFAAARQRAGSAVRDEGEIVVVNLSENLAASVPSSESDCQRMERPGSRIRGTRCYAPTEGEVALNAYQFQQELRQIRDQAAMRVMERSQLERVTLEAPTQPADTGGIR